MDLERTQLQSGQDLKRSRDLSSQRLQPPTDVPGYVADSFLGEGAYGEVWVATEINTGRKVAIKFYTHRGGLDWSLLSREVEKLAFLFADRYVVQLVDVGWDSNPPFYVMEYIEHGSLEELLQKDGAMPVDEAVNLFREIAIGLVHSHNKGVLHCDLKPANILLDEDTRPRLCDFGQSRLSHEQSPALGTLFYMAPEQADLKAIPDARWDVYALGALLYCMLTGAPPHRTNENVERIDEEPSLEKRLAAYRRLIEQSPKPALHRTVPGVDRHLAEIIDRCLAAKPGRRYENVQAVLEELKIRTRRRSRRPMLLLGAIGPAVLLVVLSLIAYQGFNTAIRESERAITAETLENARSTAMYVSEAVVGQIERRWGSLREEADDPQMIAWLRTIQESGSGGQPFQEEFAEWIRSVRERHGDLPSASWFLDDARGVQHAIDPVRQGETLGKNWSHRDYFHGQGFDAPAGTSHPPLTKPHLSIVFRSKLSGTRKVAFTVPIRDPAQPSSILGVLGMTVEIGSFLELQRDSSDLDQTVVLVDSNLDSPGSSFNRKPRAGSILEHPGLRQGLSSQETSDANAGNSQQDAIFLSEEQTQLLQELVSSKGEPSERVRQFQLQTEYRDPVTGDDSGAWLAAVVPVEVNHGNTKSSTGWAVVVQQRPEEAVAPLQSLRSSLLTLGGVALASVALVLVGMWGIVFYVNGRGRLRLLRKFRKTSFGSGTGTGGVSPRSVRKFTRTLTKRGDGTDPQTG
ncbi:MAG: protein kinase [Pirellulales bacterium]|nr:protein kinase [Pirellulales bacterium]